jgi:hypothetical protein
MRVFSRVLHWFIGASANHFLRVASVLRIIVVPRVSRIAVVIAYRKIEKPQHQLPPTWLTCDEVMTVRRDVTKKAAHYIFWMLCSRRFHFHR